MGGIGAGLFLIALGAILSFAVTGHPSWIRLDVVGWVLMVVGAASLSLGLILFRARRRGTEIIQRRVIEEPLVPDEYELGSVAEPVHEPLHHHEIIEERRTFDEPPPEF